MVGTLTGLLIYVSYVWWKVVQIMRRRGWTDKLISAYNRLMIKRLITLTKFAYAPLLETICSVFSCRRIGYDKPMYFLREDVPVNCEDSTYNTYKKVCVSRQRLTTPN